MRKHYTITLSWKPTLTAYFKEYSLYIYFSIQHYFAVVL